MVNLDPHQRPPDVLRQIYKKYAKRDRDYFKDDLEVVDFARGLTGQQYDDFVRTRYEIGEQELLEIYKNFVGEEASVTAACMEEDWRFDVFAYECRSIDGLTIIASLLPLSVQKTLLSRTFHRDFADAKHKTNVDLHYDLPRPPQGQSIFDYEITNGQILPKDAQVHKPLAIDQLLNKKLRWMTLGGQYDWTAKVYPNEQPPPFPADIKELLLRLFPQTTAEAAIVNLYSPGDTLSLHRDVAESCEHGLISLSIGCDCLFLLGLEHTDEIHAPQDDKETSYGKEKFKYTVLRLRSGDAVYMAGRSRFAWHGVPLIIPDTCPDGLKNWPASGKDDDDEYAKWRNWMSNKRINLNVRQMKAS